MVFRARQGWSAAPGWVEVSRDLESDRDPLTGVGVVYCQGLRQSVVFEYEVLLRDARGRRRDGTGRGVRSRCSQELLIVRGVCVSERKYGGGTGMVVLQ